jgi:oligosaccharide repeat unit polymerase
VDHAGAIGRGLIIAWLLLLAEILKRLAAVGWHLETAISQTMGPRGGRAWQSKLVFVGDDTFFYVLIGAVLPFAGLIFAYALVYLRGWQRIRATIGLIIVLALLISSGDRTPTLFVLGSLILFVMHARWSLWLRSTLAAAILLSGAMAVSIMYLYRGEGLSHLLADDSKATASLVYHQDDSYYRALVAIDMSGRTSQRWDWGSFFAAALVNPIPRYFWPEKPILPKNFWGAYKSYWITITYLGELAAMFGPWGVSILGVVFGVGLFLLLGWSARALNRETGILFYLVMALYVYMVMRSLLNLSQFIYLPLMSWWAVLFFISPHSGRGHGSGQVLSGARS